MEEDDVTFDESEMMFGNDLTLQAKCENYCKEQIVNIRSMVDNERSNIRIIKKDTILTIDDLINILNVYRYSVELYEVTKTYLPEENEQYIAVELNLARVRNMINNAIETEQGKVLKKLVYILPIRDIRTFNVTEMTYRKEPEDMNVWYKVTMAKTKEEINSILATNSYFKMRLTEKDPVVKTIKQREDENVEYLIRPTSVEIQKKSSEIRYEIKEYSYVATSDQVEIDLGVGKLVVNIPSSMLVGALELHQLPERIKQIVSSGCVVLDLSNMLQHLHWEVPNIVTFVDLLVKYGITVIHFTNKRVGTLDGAIELSSATHDDIVLMASAIKNDSVIITGDSFKEFRNQWMICRQHEKILIRENELCVSKDCVLRVWNNKPIKICEVYFVSEQLSSITLSVGIIQERVEGRRITHNKNMEREIIRKRPSTIDYRGSYRIGKDNETLKLWELIRDDRNNELYSIMTSETSTGIKYFIGKNIPQLMVNYINSMNNVELNKLKAHIKFTLTTDNKTGEVTVLQTSTAAWKPLVGTTISDPLEKSIYARISDREIQVIKPITSIDRDKEPMIKEVKIDNIPQAIIFNHKLTIKDLCIFVMSNKFYYCRITKEAVKKLDVLGDEMCRLNNIMKVWYKTLSGDIRQTIDLSEAQIQNTQKMFTSIRNVKWSYPTMLDYLTIQVLKENMEMLMSSSIVDINTKLGEFIYHAVPRNNEEIMGLNDFFIEIKEELSIVTTVDSFCVAINQTMGETNVIINCFTKEISSNIVIPEEIQQNIGAESIDKYKMRVAEAVVDATQRIAVRLITDQLRDMTRFLNDAACEKACKPLRLLRKFDIGLSWPKQLGNMTIVLNYCYATVVLDIVRDGVDENSGWIMYATMLVSPTICEALITPSKATGIMRVDVLMNDRTNIIAEKAMMVAFEVIPLISSYLVIKNIDINMEVAGQTVATFTEQLVSLSELLGAPLVDVVFKCYVYSFIDSPNKMRLYKEIEQHRAIESKIKVVKLQKYNFINVTLMANQLLTEENTEYQLEIDSKEYNQHLVFHELLKAMLGKSKSEITREFAKYINFIPIMRSANEVEKHMIQCYGIKKNTVISKYEQVIDIMTTENLSSRCRMTTSSNTVRLNIDNQKIELLDGSYRLLTSNSLPIILSKATTYGSEKPSFKFNVKEQKITYKYNKSIVFNTINLDSTKYLVLKPKRGKFYTARMQNNLNKLSNMMREDNTYEINYNSVQESYATLRSLLMSYSREIVTIITDDYWPSLLQIEKSKENKKMIFKQIYIKENVFLHIPDNLLYNKLKFMVEIAEVRNVEKVDIKKLLTSEDQQLVIVEEMDDEEKKKSEDKETREKETPKNQNEDGKVQEEDKEEYKEEKGKELIEKNKEEILDKIKGILIISITLLFVIKMFVTINTLLAYGIALASTLILMYLSEPFGRSKTNEIEMIKLEDIDPGENKEDKDIIKQQEKEEDELINENTPSPEGAEQTIQSII